MLPVADRARGVRFIGARGQFVGCPRISTRAATLLQRRGGGGWLAELAEVGDGVVDEHGGRGYSGTRQVARTAPTTAGGDGG